MALVSFSSLQILQWLSYNIGFIIVTVNKNYFGTFSRFSGSNGQQSLRKFCLLKFHHVEESFFNWRKPKTNWRNFPTLHQLFGTVCSWFREKSFQFMSVKQEFKWVTFRLCETNNKHNCFRQCLLGAILPRTWYSSWWNARRYASTRFGVFFQLYSFRFFIGSRLFWFTLRGLIG